MVNKMVLLLGLLTGTPTDLQMAGKKVTLTDSTKVALTEITKGWKTNEVKGGLRDWLKAKM